MAERHADRAFQAARSEGPLALQAFLRAMPKGADLHMHLSGAVYAETFLRDAIADGLCIQPERLVFVKQSGTPPSCPGHSKPAASVLQDQNLYDALVDAFSMRSFVPTPGVSGHDQFFATFERFGGLDKSHAAEWLDEIATRAAAQNEQYLEVMMTPGFAKAAALGAQFGWPQAAQTPGPLAPKDESTGTSRAQLSALRDKLLASGLREDLAADRAELDSAVAGRRQLEHCDTPAAAPACAVEIRLLYQVLRAFPPQQVFAQTLLAFEVASVDSNVVGLNFVQPEDAFRSMSEYHRQMLMLDYLHSVYPAVHLSLHAGELAPGLVPPEGLRFHIRQAVALGHAERIGHGVDVLYEDNPAALLQQLAASHVAVEINLTSNQVILGIDPAHSPLPAYRAAHVPLTLATDDEGVSRIDLTHEYTRAALEYHLTYADLKQIARTSVAHTFLPGVPLFSTADAFTQPVAACAMGTVGAETPPPKCRRFLQASPHAAQQWELERRFRIFEAALP